MNRYYLAIDIGASSGRHILARRKGGRIELEEIYRFSNGIVEKDGEKVWDIDQLFEEIKNGMKRCAALHKIPYSVGIDTWAVDFVLLDEKNQRIGNAVAYRDNRTRGMEKEVYDLIEEKELYTATGIQKQSFNTIYQLMAVKKRHPKQLEAAGKMLMIPDYFHFLLTGRIAAEYTNASTTQLISTLTKDWNWSLIHKLGFPRRLFQTILPPGSELGMLTEKMAKEIGYHCKVVLPATHDTGSAVMAVPENKEDILYISSGTWSLMGTELMTANCSKESRLHNLTNEGGFEYRFRYLKNIMGLWMIQSVKKEIGGGLSFGEICTMASDTGITSRIDCNDERFLSPENMTKEVQKACQETNQQVPEGIAEVAAVIYRSLAECYAKTLKEIEEMTGKEYDRIHIVGGGSNAGYLNQLTADAAGKPVYAGPTEATAIGNITAQMIAGKEFTDLKDARINISQSFPIQVYEPKTE